MEICKKCGLPKELCVCGTITKESQKIKIILNKRRYGKMITVVEGLTSDIDLKQLSKDLKHKLACGGTFKNGTIELQGNHRDRVKKVLVEFGFPEDRIEA